MCELTSSPAGTNSFLKTGKLEKVMAVEGGWLVGRGSLLVFLFEAEPSQLSAAAADQIEVATGSFLILYR